MCLCVCVWVWERRNEREEEEGEEEGRGGEEEKEMERKRKKKRRRKINWEREKLVRHGLPGSYWMYLCRSATSAWMGVGRKCISRVPYNLWRKVCAFGEGKPASVFAALCEHRPNNRHLRKTPVPGKQREDLISTTSFPSGCLLWKQLKGSSSEHFELSEIQERTKFISC